VLRAKIDAGVLGPAATCAADLPDPEHVEDRYGLIVSLLALHHVADVPSTLLALRRLLAAGGDLVLLDLDAEDGTFHDDPGFDGPHGFDREALRALVVASGLRTVTFDHCMDLEKRGRTYPMFVMHARG
jgi:SAM-dependent methyltransferase